MKIQTSRQFLVRLAARRSAGGLIGLAFLGLASSANAAATTWTGAGANGNWQTGANWAAGTVPAAGDTETFNNATNTAVTFTALTQTNGITWDTGAGSFTYSSGGTGFILNPNASGGSFTINAGVTSQTETFNADVKVFSGRTSPATFTFTDNSTTSGFVFTNMYGDETTTGIAATLAFRGTSTVGSTVNGVISDHNGTAGGTVIVQKTGGAAGTLTLNGANTYSGGTDLSSGSGTIVLGNKAALGTGTFRVSGGTVSSNTVLTGVNAIANTVSFIGASGTATTTNAVVSVTAGSNTGTLTGGTAPAVGDLVAQGSNLPAFTTVTAVSGTTITFSSNAVATGTPTLTTNPFSGSGTSTLNIGGSTALEFSGTQNLTSTLSNGLAATQTFNVTNTALTTFSGVLQEQAGVGSIIKSGVGVLTLSGANTFSGGVQINGGTLNINNASALGTGAFALTASGVSFNNTSGAAITLSNNNPVTLNGNFNFTGTNSLNFGTGAVTLTATTALIYASGNTLTFGGVISGAGDGITKNNAGTLVLGGANAYTGATVVNGGALLVNGSTNAASAVTVANSGTTLGGTGTINGTVSVGAASRITGGTAGSGNTLVTGNVGTLSTGALTLASTSVYLADIAGDASFDQLNVTGTVGLGGATLTLNIPTGIAFTNGARLTLIANDGTDAISSTFANLAQGATLSANGYSFTADYAGGDGNDFDLVVAVPEPATYLGGSLMLGLAAWSQRKRVGSLLKA